MTQTLPLILAADIGGTNTRVALLDGTSLREQTVARYADRNAESLEQILSDFLNAQNDAVQPDAVSLALAGPVNGDSGRLTNLDWEITTKGACAASGARFGVLSNDLQAQGHALPFLPARALTPVLAAPPSPSRTPCLMIGVGTGLNVAPVHHFEQRTFVPPAEAGHISFAQQGNMLSEYVTALGAKIGHVAAEDILSGRGLERAYEHFSGVALPAGDIMAACASDVPAARDAARVLVQALGHYAGDMALTHLPRGGIFLVGGVARALLPYYAPLGFAECFAQKGRFSDFMAQFSVQLVDDDYAALIGSASFAQESLMAA